MYDILYAYICIYIYILWLVGIRHCWQGEQELVVTEMMIEYFERAESEDCFLIVILVIRNVFLVVSQKPRKGELVKGGPYQPEDESEWGKPGSCSTVDLYSGWMYFQWSRYEQRKTRAANLRPSARTLESASHLGFHFITLSKIKLSSTWVYRTVVNALACTHLHIHVYLHLRLHLHRRLFLIHTNVTLMRIIFQKFCALASEFS